MPVPASALHHRVHIVLRAGVVASGLLLAAGLALVLAGDPSGAIPTSVPAALRGALRGDGVSLIVLGLLVLMATPISRVAILAAGWFREGDRRFAAVAGAVLAILALGVVLGVG